MDADSLDDRIRAKALDWAWPTEPGGLGLLQRWEDDVFAEGGSADLILGADIVSTVKLTDRQAQSLMSSGFADVRP